MSAPAAGRERRPWPGPLALDLWLERGRVVDAEARPGRHRRGVEALALAAPLAQVVDLAERTCGGCSFTHALGASLGLEALLGIEVPERARVLRLLWAELSRAQSHLGRAALTGAALGAEGLSMHSARLREGALDLLERTTGGRVILAACRVGGVRRDLDRDARRAVAAGLDALAAELPALTRAFTEDRAARRRLEGAGAVTAEEARALGAVGPLARAAGLAVDARAGGALDYGRLGFEPVVEAGGDALARARVRLREVAQSLELARQLLGALERAAGPLSAEVDPARAPAGLAEVRLEGPRGEARYELAADGGGGLSAFRVRTASEANLPAALRAVRGAALEELPVVVASLDPCPGCLER